MRTFLKFLLFIATVSFLQYCTKEYKSGESQESGNAGSWELGPFEKILAHNPVLLPLDSTTFYCPVRQERIHWESKDVFNPAALIHNDTLFLLYRAEDTIGKFSGTSRIGLAYSLNGYDFVRRPEPVLYPDNDEYLKYEWEGGIEDPRVVETEDGRYIVTYSSYDGEFARLCVAESTDLIHWQKHGPVFTEAYNGQFLDHWSKSGAIICRKDKEKFIGWRIDGQYWMYWGDTDLFLATSDDLIHWVPVLNDNGTLQPILRPREKMFDSRLVESGPPAFITENGILLLYNGMNLDAGGDPELPPGTYASGQALFDKEDPAAQTSRSNHYFLYPSEDYEIQGQIGNVCFIEGLVDYKGNWLLYYGTADSKIALAVSGSGL